MIAQSLVSRLSILKEQRLNLDREARQLEKEEKELTSQIMRALKDKQEVEKGAFSVSISYGGTYPSWKEEFIKACGEKKAQEVIANTPAKEILLIEVAE